MSDSDGLRGELRRATVLYEAGKKREAINVAGDAIERTAQGGQWLDMNRAIQCDMPLGLKIAMAVSTYEFKVMLPNRASLIDEMIEQARRNEQAGMVSTLEGLR